MSAYGDNPDGTARTDYWWNDDPKATADRQRELDSQGLEGKLRGIGHKILGGGGQSRANLDETGLASNQFAEYNQGGVQQLGGEASAQRDYLRRLASGQDSVSAEQLRQGLGQNLSAQQSYAAGASPQNAAMAARTGAMQMGRMGSGLSGQQALAGLQERQNANQQLTNAILQQRGQDMQGALGARQTAVGAYGGGKPDQSWLEKNGPALAAGMAAMSDRRLKTDISDGDAKAKTALEGLKSYAYKYKNEAHGKGDQLGLMAQDMEKAGLGHAVSDTPGGKMVNGAKAALSGLALTAALARRVSRLEGGK